MTTEIDRLELCEKEHLVALATLAAILCLPRFEEEYPKDNGPRQSIYATLNWIKNPSQKMAEKVKAAKIKFWTTEAGWKSALWAAEAAGAAAIWAEETETKAAVKTAGAAAIAVAASWMAASGETFKENFNCLAEQLLDLPKNKLADFLEEKLREKVS